MIDLVTYSVPCLVWWFFLTSQDKPEPEKFRIKSKNLKAKTSLRFQFLSVRLKAVCRYGTASALLCDVNSSRTLSGATVAPTLTMQYARILALLPTRVSAPKTTNFPTRTLESTTAR